MNKNAIKKFAIEARQKLIRSVSDKAGMIGITENLCSEPITKGMDFEVYLSTSGREETLFREQCEQRKQLVSQIKSRGFEAVVEEVAYTWFNRICAIRFMEVNDYLPNRVRVLSAEKKGKMEPDLVTQAPDVDLDLTAQEKEEIINWKLSGSSEDTDKLYCKLFLKQCHQLHDILPGLFEADYDYMELLFGISYTNKDDVIYMLVNSETGIPENDFNVSALDEEGNPTGQVEIIGWLYQYYNTELKDDTFAKLKKNVKITKERIPAATQLFTPDWIVRYMVENSVGRIWIEHLRAIDPTTDEKAAAERFGWKYYLPEAEQEEAVNVKLAEIRSTYKDLKPTDITCIDPCMGSGHILIAMFDVLMDIYESAGYDKRDAAFEIVEHNIHGLDIDQRAYQLAYFAVMMKGRGYNRRFLRGGKVLPHVYRIKESGFIDRDGDKKYSFDQATLDYFVGKNVKLKISMKNLIEQMFDALEYGSIIKIENVDFDLIFRRFKEIEDDISIYKNSVFVALYPFTLIAYMLTKKYDVVITNPPYMGASGMGSKLLKSVKEKYPDSKNDLFAVFIEKCNQVTKNNGFQSMITQHAWMFISSYEKLRNKLQQNNYVSMAHLGSKAFEEIAGEVVQTTSFIIRKNNIAHYKGTYCRLVDETTQDHKEQLFLSAKKRYYANQDNYRKIPGSPVAYWASNDIFKAFDNGKPLGELGIVRNGMKTGDNESFIRLWWEIAFNKMNSKAENYIEAVESGAKWFPYNKGGEFRKWYGNNEWVVNWENEGDSVIGQAKKDGRHVQDYPNNMKFLPAVSWSLITTNKPSFRYKQYHISDIAGMSLYAKRSAIIDAIGLLNTNVALDILNILAPTINFQAGDIARIPYISPKEDVQDLVEKAIDVAKEDWDSFETSWDFKKHPLIPEKLDNQKKIEKYFEKWSQECCIRFASVKSKEERLNHIYIKTYGLENNLNDAVEDKDITIYKADLYRDIRSFISYAVGCMLGRYSLDEEGVIFASNQWENCRYKTFMPDEDNCIPITDEEYFSDDIVARFVEFVKTVYGSDTLEENLDFIAKALGNKGNTSREVIRNYFLKDFYADHLKVYQKRPIYWLFDSGKQNGFKALIYMHRYDADTVGRVRNDYLHRAQKYVETAMQSAQYIIENASSASEKSKATKAVTKYTKQLAEMKIYDEAIAHIANKRIEIDLDDGVKVNYAKFQGVEVAQEGKKTLKVDLLAKIK